MKYGLLLLVLLSYKSIFSITWEQMLTNNSFLLEKYNGHLLVKQLKLFQENSTPAISDIRIKTIPIIENGEELVDIRVINHPRISMLPNPGRPFERPDCNSGFECASCIRLKVFEKLKAMLIHLDALAANFGYESGLISITVFEALRDIKTQEILFNNKRKEIKQANQAFDDAQLDAETSKWVSPVKDNIPVHSTGAAVDIRLSYNGTFIDMGAFGAIWGANPTAVTFSENITDTQKDNRLYLLLAATMAGLVNYSYEFWHFSTGDRYYYWQELPEKTACYNSVT